MCVCVYLGALPVLRGALALHLNVLAALLGDTAACLNALAVHFGAPAAYLGFPALRPEASAAHVGAMAAYLGALEAPLSSMKAARICAPGGNGGGEGTFEDPSGLPEGPAPSCCHTVWTDLVYLVATAWAVPYCPTFGQPAHSSHVEFKHLKD